MTFLVIHTRQLPGLVLNITALCFEFLAELLRCGDAHLIVKDPVRIQVFPNIFGGNLIGLNTGFGVVLVHEIADNVVLSDVFRAGELDALSSLKVEAGLRE